MPNDLVNQLRNLANTTRRGVTEHQDTFLTNVQETTIDWQLLANYLDGRIFEFIMQNKHDPKVKDFGVQLARDLANKFNITE